jgi:hypothetical protein
MDIRIVLDEEAFKKLVSGQEISHTEAIGWLPISGLAAAGTVTVHVTLQDIGLDVMLHAIASVLADQGIRRVRVLADQGIRRMRRTRP